MPDEEVLAVAEKVLRAAGARAGQRCIDFGCGRGIYAIALAGIVAPGGAVCALDTDRDKLKELTRRAQVRQLTNVTAVQGECLSECGGPADLVLLYDVLHEHYFSPKRRRALFEQIARQLTPNGRVSVFPHHMSDDEIQREIITPLQDAGFSQAGEYHGPVVHDESICEGAVWTFCRRGEPQNQEG
ncbi:MAG: class I SAM-dependent methyltransferase [Phycisphaerae bacterium]|nr:class I SAM-dependent methyltransferase [Phycisphaerae bacterium]